MLSNAIGETPESQPETDRTDGKDIAIAAMEARIESLETQLTAKDQQIDRTTPPTGSDRPKRSPSATLVENMEIVTPTISQNHFFKD